MPMHGGQPSCERCIAEVQVAHARERARQLPALEARLADLGGPAPEVLCGYAGWSYGGDPFKFGEFCVLPQYHEDFHRTAPAGEV